MHFTSNFLRIWLFNRSHDVFGKRIDNYSRVKPENIIKIKHYICIIYRPFTKPSK